MKNVPYTLFSSFIGFFKMYTLEVGILWLWGKKNRRYNISGQFVKYSDLFKLHSLISEMTLSSLRGWSQLWSWFNVCVAGVCGGVSLSFFWLSNLFSEVGALEKGSEKMSLKLTLLSENFVLPFLMESFVSTRKIISKLTLLPVWILLRPWWTLRVVTLRS
jgi:hypothetical protein